MTSHRRWLGVAVLLPLTIVTVPPGAGHAVEPAVTGFYMTVEQDEFVGYDVASTAAFFTRTAEGVYIGNGGSGDGFSVLMGAPGLAALSTGTYEHAEEYVGGDRARPVLDVEGNGHGCDQTTGRFQVDQLETDAEGTITRFAARFEHHCEGADPAMFGTIAVNASVPVFGHSLTERRLIFNNVLGHGPSFQQIVVTNTGPSPLPFYGATISGREASSFELIDNCAATTVAPGASCTIGVNARPTDNHARATLTIRNAFTSWEGGSSGQRIPMEVSSDLPAGGETHLITPVRILDTREAAGLTGGVKLGTTALTVPAAGLFAIPQTATGLLINVTVAGPTTSGYLTVFPSDVPQPTVSNLNFAVGQTLANFAAISLGNSGALKVVNSAGSAHVMIDVLGWVGSSDEQGVASVVDVFPNAERFLDTRPGPGKPATPLGPGESRKLTFTGTSVLPNGGAAVLVNLTVAKPTTSTYITAYPASATRPNTSNINVAAGQTRANLTLVKLDATGSARFYNAFGSTPLIIDVVAVFIAPANNDFGRIVFVDPWRLVDTRSGEALPPNSTTYASYLSPRTDDLVTDQARFAIVNATATRGTASGYLTLQKPWVAPSSPFSNLNWIGPTVPNGAVIPTFGEVDIVNHSLGSVHVLLDLQAIIT